MAAILLGGALGVCYDVLRILRIAIRHGTFAVAVEDILFSALCAAATFFYQLLADCGRIRMFVLIGELIGFILYYCTVGACLIGISKRIIGAVKWVLGILGRLLVRPVLHILRKLQAKWAQIARRLALFIKKQPKNMTSHLKKQNGLLYNLKSSIRGKRRKNRSGKAGL